MKNYHFLRNSIIPNYVLFVDKIKIFCEQFGTQLCQNETVIRIIYRMYNITMLDRL